MDFKAPATLGRTGLKVSRLGLASGYSVPAAAVERAYREFGINYFFWSVPRRTGMEEGLRSLARTDRERIVIGVQTYGRFGIRTEHSLDGALKRLGTDYADILFLGAHGSMPFRKLLDTAQELKHRGKVRHIGMSGHNRPFFGKLLQAESCPIDVFMIRYNAAHPGAEQDIFPHIKKGERPGITIFTATSWRRLLKPERMPQGEAPLSAADCYRFVLSNPNVDVCLFGPSSMEQMIEGVSALQKGPLSDAEMKRARAIGKHVHG